MRLVIELARAVFRVDLPHWGLAGVNYGRHARVA
jgi:hypothetical protein